ncbi:MAG: 3-oxoacyl-[acyl-carrier protein] reductase [Gammaproteobacteria bacterium]
MDLEIAGKKAIVCASSKGLGKACAIALANEGVAVTITARTEATLLATAEEIRSASGARVTTVVGDITTVQGREAVLHACPQPDILINNAGGPAPGDFRQWSLEDWQHALNANMLTAIELIRATIDGMIERKFGRVVNITSAAAKTPIDILDLSNGARAGLTGFVAGIARKTVRHNVTINGLSPGAFDTEHLRGGIAARATSARRSIEQTTDDATAANPGGRFGTPAQFGQACALLCSAQAGFITGQNLLMDGGAFPGTL